MQTESCSLSLVILYLALKFHCLGLENLSNYTMKVLYLRALGRLETSPFKLNIMGIVSIVNLC